MKTILSLAAALLLSFAGKAATCPVPYQASGAYSIPFSVSLENREPVESDIWTVSLEGLENAPMPEKSVMTVTPGEDGAKSYRFHPIYYDQDDINHVYHYMLRISGPADSLLTYDTVKSVTVRVSGNSDGTLSITSYADKMQPAFVNRYYRASCEMDLKFILKIEGRDFNQEDQWSFYVSADEHVPLPEKTEVLIHPVSGNEIEVSFGKIHFNELDIDQTFYYTISEFCQAGGVQNGTARIIQIQVTDNGDGSLSAAPVKDSDLLFEKQYHAEAEENILGMMTITGRSFIAGDEWTCVLTGEAGSPMPENTELIVKPAEGSSQKLNFGSIHFSEKDAGHTYVYHIAVNGVNAGIANAADQEFRLSVTDQGDGKLAVKRSPENLLFEMIYSAKGEFVLSGVKNLIGRHFREGDHWTIHLTGDQGIPLPKNNTLHIQYQEGTIPRFAFDPIIFTEADDGKEYRYIVSESSDIPGVTLDRDHLVYVRVHDNLDGTLSIDSSTDGKLLAFVDTYDAHGSLVLKNAVSLTGRKLTEDDSWTLVLSADDDVPLPDQRVVELRAESGESLIPFEFEPIEFSLKDVGKKYIYTLSEEGEIPGVDSFEPVQISVSVDDGGDGQLIVNTVYPPRIENVYHAAGNVKVEGSLVFTGRDLLDDDCWALTVYGEKGAPMPERSAVSIVPGENEKLIFDFGAISFTEADAGKTYKYNVNADSLMKGVSNETGYSFSVTVHDNTDGTLKVISSLTEPLILHSAYTALGSANLHGILKLEGRSFQPGDSWKLSLKSDESSPKPDLSEITLNPIFGHIIAFDFGQITFTEEDRDREYCYQVLYDSQSKGIEKSEPQLITIRIRDNLDGTLDVGSSMKDEGLELLSKYSSKALLKLSINKIITGREFCAGNLWKYTLTGSEGAPMPANSIVVFQEPEGGNQAEIVFDDILFTDEMNGKVFTYTLEESTELQGVSKNNPYSFEVRVEDDLNGTLSLKKSPDIPEQIPFISQYAASTEFELAGELTMENRSFLAGDHWILTVSSDPETAPQPEKWKLELMPSEGSSIHYSFGTIHFNQTHIGQTFRYIISSSCKMPGVESSRNMIVDVTVQDNGDGSLAILLADGTEILDIKNVYTAHGGISLSADLTIHNRDFMAADRFDFFLEGEEFAPMPEQTHITVFPDDDHTEEAISVNFGMIMFTEKDIGKTYRYTMNQEAAAPALVIPDPVRIEIRVEDQGNGLLTITSSEPEITIEDVYQSTGKLQLNAVITLAGRKYRQGDEWMMKLAGGENFPLPEQQIIRVVPEEGTDRIEVSFGEVIFSEADIGQTYSYMISLNGHVSGVQNAAPKELTVHIEDEGTGALKLTILPEKQPLLFECLYHASGSIKIEGSFSMRNRAFRLGDQWEILITSQQGAPKPELERMKLTPDHGYYFPLDFGLIHFTEADVGKKYEYVFSEIGMVNSVQNDVDKLLAVAITDNGDGTLNVKIDEASDTLDFINLYTAHGSFMLSGSIRISGRHFYADEQWIVQIEPGDTATPLPEKKEVTVISDKNLSEVFFSFGAIHLTQDDIGRNYRYTVLISGGYGDLSFDRQNEIVLTVLDRGDGSLWFESKLQEKSIDLEYSFQDDCKNFPEITV